MSPENTTTVFLPLRLIVSSRLEDPRYVPRHKRSRETPDNIEAGRSGASSDQLQRGIDILRRVERLGIGMPLSFMNPRVQSVFLLAGERESFRQDGRKFNRRGIRNGPAMPDFTKHAAAIGVVQVRVRQKR